ncbi:MAG: hypothetical protein Q7K42_03320 [Candidatus Diapherotrites archaeon]|nr:hypothetical protein [Candidatus Diapherotrites archaeon]
MATTRLIRSRRQGNLPQTRSVENSAGNSRPPASLRAPREFLPQDLERQSLTSRTFKKDEIIHRGPGNYFSDQVHYFSFPDAINKFRTLRINPVQERQRYADYQRMRSFQARIFASIGTRNLFLQLRNPNLDIMHVRGIRTQIAEFQKVKPLTNTEKKEFRELMKKFTSQSLEESNKQKRK